VETICPRSIFAQLLLPSSPTNPKNEGDQHVYYKTSPGGVVTRAGMAIL